MDCCGLADICRAGRCVLIRIRDLTFQYRNSNAASLNCVDLDIAEGEFLVLTGPSGCGKTTLSRIFNRLCPEYYQGEISGSYLIDEKNMMQSSVCEAAAMIGSVFQDPRTQFFTRDTISEVAFGCENQGLTRGEIKERTDRTFRDLGLEHLKGKNLLQLSSGERQFIAIASVYCTDPRIMVFDEPSANLDRACIEKLGNILHMLKKQGKTIIISEHRLYYLRELMDRMILLKDGEVAGILSAEEAGKLSDAERETMGVRSLRQICMDGKELSGRQEKFEDGGKGLAIRHLDFAYGRAGRLYKDASYYFPCGKVTGVIGRNGCGKTSLLELICGLRKPKEGEFILNGEPLSCRKRISAFYCVMQDVDYQVFTESVTEEMLLGCPDGERKTKRNRAEQILKEFGLYDLMDRHPATLSGGQKQRLSIAIACMKDAPVICFDEPTSGLDLHNMEIVSKAIRKLADEGRTVIVVSHDDELIGKTCDRVIMNHLGRF